MRRQIPYVHKKVKLNDLKPPRQCLLSDEEIYELKQEIKGNGIVKYLDNPRDIEIIKDKDKFYAVYGAKSTSKCLGSGTFGAVYLMQDLDTGEWLAIKKQIVKKGRGEHLKQLVNHENNALQSIGEFHFSFKYDGPPEQYLSAMSLGAGANLFNGVIGSRRKFQTVRWFDMAVSGLRACLKSFLVCVH